MRVAALLLAAAICFAEVVPQWVITGIAAVETGSYFKSGRLVYVDQRDGRHGEVGPFQMTRAAYEDIKGHEDSFTRMRHDPKYAERLACRYLLKLRAGGKRSWEEVVGLYNGGRRVQWAYAERVKNIGTATL